MAKKKAAAKKAIESYTHADKKRANNPPVGLVTPATDPTDPPKKTYAYDPHLDPQLVWAGKAERTSFEVPVVSLHVHERIDPMSIIKAVRTNGNGESASGTKLRQRSLFEEPEANPPLRDALDFYRHPHGWTNRLVAGDSLLVMNSLLEKEGMAGKVQMVYFDPPYGIRYGSNFQPFVNRRDVKDGKDEDLSQEPETLKAFRDTWELGIHSYLTYLRDRLLLAKDLLHESGSVFVQISDENLHFVREILDEVYGRDCFVSIIQVVKTSGLSAKDRMPTACDYIVWYSRDREKLKYRQLYSPKEAGREGLSGYTRIQLPDGSRRKLTADEMHGRTTLPAGARRYKLDNLTKPGPGSRYEFTYEGVTYTPGKRWWGMPIESMESLAERQRLEASGRNLWYVRFWDDFAWSPRNNLWTDTASSFMSEKVYVVQTTAKIIERCMLMVTDPGDLVLDPTCGSGTTAAVAEQWGRRWITCDTSRVAVTLAKQRLMTSAFDFYKLAHEREGVGSGFVYKSVAHVTLKSIANNPEIKEGMTRTEIDAAIARYAEQETLYDQPDPDRSKARVTGPFTVEAVPAIAVRPIETIEESQPLELQPQRSLPGVTPHAQQNLVATTSVSRFGETQRQAMWRDELLASGVRGKGGQRIKFARLEPSSGTRWLHCVGETSDAISKRVAVSFGPEHAPLEQRQVEKAWEEARMLNPRPDMLLFASFHFDPEAGKDIDELTPEKTGMVFLRSQMNTDLLTEDLKKKRASNESFWLIGQPDIDLRQLKKGEHKGQWQVEVRGFDYYNPVTGQIESGDTTKIAMWLLDTDYDGRSLFPRQVFFPMAGEKDGWARLAANLKAEIDEERIEAYRGTESLPFEPGEHRRIGVKIVDDRGIESLKLMEIE